MSDQKIKAIIKELEDYTVVKCDMIHEEVLINEQGIPICQNEGENSTFQRRSLCSAEVRNMRLGCAHSPSNQRFIQTLWHAEVIDPKFLDLVNNLEKELMQIYIIDHKKGDLERSLALSFNNSIEKDIVLSQIDCVIRDHRKIINRIEEIKASVIGFLKNYQL